MASYVLSEGKVRNLTSMGEWGFMNIALKLIVAGLVLTATGFAQEPKAACGRTTKHRQVQSIEWRGHCDRFAGASAPKVQPKALPPLNPSLGEIARRVRAAHAEAPKAQMVVADDAPPHDK